MDLPTRLRTVLETRGTWISLAFAFLVVDALVERHLEWAGPSGKRAGDLVPATGMGALAGARLLAVAADPARYLSYPADLVLPTGGLSLPGAFLGAALACLWYARRAGLPALIAADALALYAPLGFAISRLGCLPEGTCYGKAGPRPFAVTFPGIQQPRYPVDLYEALAALLIFGVLLYAASGRPRPGLLTAAFLAAYPACHAALGFLRITPSGAPVTAEQAFFLAVAGAGTLGVAYLARRQRPAAGTAPAHPGEP